MRDATFNYVRVFRQRHALSEHELAKLMGKRGHTAVSHMEGGDRGVTLRDALALQVLFRQEPRRLFPGLFDVVEEEVMARAKAMIDSLAGKADVRSIHKREFLEGLAAPDGAETA